MSMSLLVLDWGAAEVLETMKSLQDSSTFTDVVFVCSDGARVAAHKAALERHSSFFREVFRRQRGCCCNCDNSSSSNNNNNNSCCNDLSEDCVFLLPDTSSSDLNVLLQILYTGQTGVLTSAKIESLHGLCRRLRLFIPMQVVPTDPLIILAPPAEDKEEEEVVNNAGSRKRRRRSPFPPSSSSTSNPSFRCPKCSSSFPLASTLRHHMRQEHQPLDVRQVEQVAASVVVDDDGAPLGGGVGKDDDKEEEIEEEVEDEIDNVVVEDDDDIAAADDDDDHEGGGVVEDEDPDDVRVEVDVDPRDYLADNNEYLPPPPPVYDVEDDDEDLQEEQQQQQHPYHRDGGAVRLPLLLHFRGEGTPCPTCYKLYPNSKIREHLASTHLNHRLRCYVDAEDARRCGLCEYSSASASGVARHVGLRHNKIEEFMDDAQREWVLGINGRGGDRCNRMMPPTQL